MSPSVQRVLRVVAAVAIAIGGYAHYDLWHTAGYRYTPVGGVFQLDYIASFVIAVLLLVGPRRVVTFLGAGVSFVTLLAFILSRGPGVPTPSGVTFKEKGLSPQTLHLLGPEIAVTVLIVESVGLVLSAVLFLSPVSGPSGLPLRRRTPTRQAAVR
jgi:hypothetical protein